MITGAKNLMQDAGNLCKGLISIRLGTNSVVEEVAVDCVTQLVLLLCTKAHRFSSAPKGEVVTVPRSHVLMWQLGCHAGTLKNTLHTLLIDTNCASGANVCLKLKLSTGKWHRAIVSLLLKSPNTLVTTQTKPSTSTTNTTSGPLTDRVE